MGVATGTAPEFKRGSMRAIRDSEFGYAQARHLLWRAGFGGSPEQIQTLAAWGPEKAVDHLLDVEEVPYSGPSPEFDAEIIRPPTEEERIAYRRAQQAGDENFLARVRLERQRRQRDDRRQMRLVQRWWLTRLIETPRPLEEKMTLFWHGHFATSYRKIENSYHMLQQNMMFRQHALGNYGDLMFRIIRDPAMIRYLDNNISRREQPNENLARELMELFSLGEGNYSERDIKEGARTLTGFTYEDDDFVFMEDRHDTGVKNVLGASGRLDGDGFVRAILGQRACSKFMARKLYRFFVEDVPDDDRDTDPGARKAIGQLASWFLSARYSMRPTLRRLFLSEHFYSEGVVGQQIKSPVVLVVGAVRSLETPVRDLSILLEAIDLMGQNIFYPPSVKGWDGGRSWINTSTLFVRQNILAYLLVGKKPQGYDAIADREVYDPTPLLSVLERLDPGAQRDPQKVCDYLLRFTLGSAPEPARHALIEFVESHGGRLSPDMLTGLLLLITAMPEYQLT